MSEQQGQGKAFDNEQRSAEVKSSAEKLQDAEPVGSQTPGAENPAPDFLPPLLFSVRVYFSLDLLAVGVLRARRL